MSIACILVYNYWDRWTGDRLGPPTLFSLTQYLQSVSANGKQKRLVDHDHLAPTPGPHSTHILPNSARYSMVGTPSKR